MNTDLWHYSRKPLAEQVLGMFDSGLSSALTFFAPRRMGKTEFLRKDIAPLAESKGWRVLYFSFLDADETGSAEFVSSLIGFMDGKGVVAKAKGMFRAIGKVSGEAGGFKAGVELNDKALQDGGVKDVIDRLAKKHKRVLLLLDEVQALAQGMHNVTFVAALRTALDMHKDQVKVIFTGSSREGLRRMFSEAKAPFFHFGQNLPFPEFDSGFTDHLAEVFQATTKRRLDRRELWLAFKEMQRVPQLVRSLVERMALNPGLSLEEAKHQLVTEVTDARLYADAWNACTALEQLLLIEIAAHATQMYGNETRTRLAASLGVSELPVSAVQSALRTLQKKELVGRHPDRGGYFLDDPNFKAWMLQEKI